MKYAFGIFYIFDESQDMFAKTFGYATSKQISVSGQLAQRKLNWQIKPYEMSKA